MTVTVAWLSEYHLTQGTWKLDLSLHSVMDQESDAQHGNNLWYNLMWMYEWIKKKKRERIKSV